MDAAKALSKRKAPAMADNAKTASFINNNCSAVCSSSLLPVGVGVGVVEALLLDEEDDDVVLFEDMIIIGTY